MAAILVLNGPNLNMLGQREPDQYGHQTLADIEQACVETGQKLNIQIECLQSNHEGVLIDAIHKAGRQFLDGQLLGIAFNAGAYTHTSVALHDAIKAAQVPVVEVHISNVHARESFRHHSYLSPVAAGIIVGFGSDGYLMAIQALVHKAQKSPN